MDIVKHSMGGGSDGDHSNSKSNNNNNKLYKGVRLRKWGKWVSEIRLPNSRERIWLGSYDSAEKAARAFDAALYCLRGPHASFNFPNTPFDLDINVAAAAPQSLTQQQILQIAQNFANKKDHILPTHDNEEEEEEQQQQQQQQQPSLLTCNSATATSSSTQSSMNNIDWTFLNVLDGQSSNATVGSSSSDHYGLFSNLDKMHSGDFTYSTPFFEEQIEGDIIDIDDDNVDPFSHQSSFLWSWNF